MAVTEFEGATKVTKGDGTRHLVKRSFQNSIHTFLTQFLFQLRTLATSSNRNASTETKYNSRRIVIEKQFPSYQVKLNGVCVH